VIISKAVGSDACNDIRFAVICDRQIGYNAGCHLRTFFGVAYAAAAVILKRSADVVEISGSLQYQHVGALGGADFSAKPVHP
jgi:hypothetical protein